MNKIDFKRKRPKISMEILRKDFEELGNVREIAKKRKLGWRYVYGRLYSKNLLKIDRKRKSFNNPLYINKTLLAESGLPVLNEELDVKFIPQNKKLIVEIFEIKQ